MLPGAPYYSPRERERATGQPPELLSEIRVITIVFGCGLPAKLCLKASNHRFSTALIFPVFW
jgi:hypothetical protein